MSTYPCGSSVDVLFDECLELNTVIDTLVSAREQLFSEMVRHPLGDVRNQYRGAVGSILAVERSIIALRDRAGWKGST